MTDEQIKEKVREEIYDILTSDENELEISPRQAVEITFQILAISELVIVDREVEPPAQPNQMVFYNGDYAFNQGQKSMLKAGWVKEIK